MGCAYNPDGSWTNTHYMSINGKFNDITRKDLLACAAQNNIKDASLIIDEICETAAGWPVIAANCGVSRNKIDSITSKMLLSI